MGVVNGSGPGICVFDDGPYEYYPEFKEAVKTASPEDSYLLSLLEHTLRSTSESDLNIFAVEQRLKENKKYLPTDRHLLELQSAGKYEAVTLEIERRIALDRALELFKFGQAYGPPKTQGA
jgi:hypothetical protein